MAPEPGIIRGRQRIERGMKTYVLGGGCFWCLDALYQKTRGVTGGFRLHRRADRHPDYDSVCSGMTGHAEVVAVTFDEDIIPAEVILDMFFISHDPTTLNRQGYDVGTQYRSSCSTRTSAEREDFEKARDRAPGTLGEPDRDGGVPAARVPRGRGRTTRTSTPSTPNRATAR